MFGLATAGSAAWGLAKMLLGADGVIGKGFDLAAKKADVGHLDLATLSAEKRTVLLEAVKGDTVRLKVQENLIMAAMAHPVWWWAWGLFVFPVGAYHAAIFLISTLDPWLNTPGCIVPALGQLPPAGRMVCEFFVRRVPETQEQWALSIIQTIFVAQAGTGVAAAIAQSISSIFGKK